MFIAYSDWSSSGLCSVPDGEALCSCLEVQEGSAFSFIQWSAYLCSWSILIWYEKWLAVGELMAWKHLFTAFSCLLLITHTIFTHCEG